MKVVYMYYIIKMKIIGLLKLYLVAFLLQFLFWYFILRSYLRSKVPQITISTMDQ